MSVGNMGPGKYVDLDVEALCSCGFDVINDKENGHVAIRPSDDPDDSKLKACANTRGAESNHALTDGVLKSISRKGEK